MSQITPRACNYAQWYQDVVRAADLAEAAEVVKGCMVIKPHGYAIWENIQTELNRRFKRLGVQNAYFPLLIPESFLQKEKEHVQGFSPELAVVTHAGGKRLEEAYVIRPTSETIIGHFFARWIQSHRDLPLRINQWANVVRWELRTRMFLRTSEFLWQEGHTAHSERQEAEAEAKTMLQCYVRFVQDFMAIPVVFGLKTTSEKFAGADASWSLEAMMQDGKALQMGTSHHLGQNFGRAFNITYQNQAGELSCPWQTSWGVSTRLMGGLIMVHSDDAGLVLPPSLAPVAVVIVPIVLSGQEAATLAYCEQIKQQLDGLGIATHLDRRELKPGFKFFEWEQKGACLRLEVGPKEVAAQQVVCKMRHQPGKQSVAWTQLATYVQNSLSQMQQALSDAARHRFLSNMRVAETYAELTTFLAQEPGGFVLAHWDGSASTEADIKQATKATIRVIPDFAAQPWLDPCHAQPGRCVKTGASSKQRVVFARAY